MAASGDREPSQLSLHPHRALCSLSHRYGPLMILYFGRVPTLVVSSADTALDALKTHDLKFSNRPVTKMVDKLLNSGRDLAFAPYGEYWRQVKVSFRRLNINLSFVHPCNEMIM